MSAPSPVQDQSLGFPLEEHVALGPLTTFGIGGPARHFSTVTTEAELAAACGWAQARDLPLFVLGGGSNVLVADQGFSGIVLHIGLRGVTEELFGERRLYTVAAGEDWDSLVTRSVEAGCAGIECLAGIPGSVGGTPVQNVGAYGQEVAEVIEGVRCFDRTTGQFVSFTNAECGFAYRTSRFNTADRGRYIVTQACFALRPAGAATLRYGDVQRAFAGRTRAPSLTEVAEAVRAIRRTKGMVVDQGPLAARDPDTRSAGSFFKNPVVSQARYEAMESAVAPLPVPSFPASAAPDGSPQRKLAAAWLVEHAGFAKGFALGGAALSSRHTLALTNHSGAATAAEICALRDRIIEGVAARFGVVLEPEPVSLS